MGYLSVASNKTTWIVKVSKTKYTMKDFKCKEQFCCQKSRQQSIAGGNFLVRYCKRVISVVITKFSLTYRLNIWSTFFNIEHRYKQLQLTTESNSLFFFKLYWNIDPSFSPRYIPSSEPCFLLLSSPSIVIEGTC